MSITIDALKKAAMDNNDIELYLLCGLLAVAIPALSFAVAWALQWVIDKLSR